jgi:hypothetical protein
LQGETKAFLSKLDGTTSLKIEHSSKKNLPTHTQSKILRIFLQNEKLFLFQVLAQFVLGYIPEIQTLDDRRGSTRNWVENCG